MTRFLTFVCLSGLIGLGAVLMYFGSPMNEDRSISWPLRVCLFISGAGVVCGGLVFGEEIAKSLDDD